MEIIQIAAELAPLAKVGGLADVVHGLSRGLLQKNHTVTVILPKYDTLDLSSVEQLEVVQKNAPVRFRNETYTSSLWSGKVDEIPVLLIESQAFFARKTVYGCEDDCSRFAYFCQAALECIKMRKPDVIHIHDWHTALVAPLIKEKHPEINAQIIFTIHNLAYQGCCTKESLDFTHPTFLEGNEYNLLKAGILFADQVTTVSPHYAHEILTTEMGGNLQTVLKKYQNKFSGILNGIDYSYWNPETDPYLPFHYSAHSIKNKEKNKQELKKKLALDHEQTPLVCAIARLVPQKGPELIKAALLRTLENGGQFILLGSAPDEETLMRFDTLKRKLKGSRHVHLELTFDEELSHLVYAASDLCLVPSLFEPCGLTQQIALHYGSLPLVRETGGLVDTVIEGKNGFTFGPPTAEAICTALDRAFYTWKESPKTWQSLVQAGMQENLSWDKPTDAYLKIYRASLPV